MASTTTSISVQRYTIGWIAALSIELAAATAMLDVEHRKPTDFQQRSDDSNYYTWGSIGSHNVVIACLVGGRYGTVSAATTALTMRSSLPHLKVCFMVGIGAGVPQGQSDIDIRLGDVVVSHPSGSSPGVIQYNIGKVKADGVFERTGSLRSSPDALLNAITKLRAQHHIKRRSKIGPILEEMYVRHPEMKEIDEDGGAGFVHQGTVRDRLFQADYLHAASESKKSGQDDELSSCFACDSAYEVERSTRKNVVPRIHYGTIASGDCVIRDAITRDQVVAALGCPCLCFEMEAAGLMNAFPCIVIRGICDYADTHKNDNWQPYAAATAAAYAKELVLILDHQDVDNTPSLQVVADSFVRQIEAAMQPLHASIKEIGSTIEVGRNNSPLDCLQVAHDATFDSHVEQTKARCLANTRVDILDMIHRWTDDEAGRTIFWLNGPAGCGKSTVSRTVARALHSKQRLAASFFFKRGEGSRSLATRFFPTLARQLATFPELGEHIVRACRDDPQVGAGALVDQFQALISDPLTHSKVPMSRADALIIVVDALDECSHEDDLRTILELFERFKKQTRLRLFVTSRPELPITLQFSRMSSDLFHDVDLHSATVGKIEDDIRVLLKHEFAWRARAPEQQWNDLNGTKPWPDLPTIEKLAQIANPLFIIAATIVRYVWESPENPRIRLDHLLHNWASKTSSQMELMYLPVLQQLSTKHSDQGHILSQFRSLMGAIVVLLEPMSRNSLEVLGFGEQMHILQSLRSVLEVPKDPDKPIRFLHLSFRDFLISRRGMNDPCPAGTNLQDEIYIDECEAHRDLADRCPALMSSSTGLCRDICQMKRPGIQKHEITKAHVEERIPRCLSYACRYWVAHIDSAKSILVDGDVTQVFLKRHILHWIEAMSWLGEIDRCVSSVETLHALATTHAAQNTTDYLYDVKRTLLYHGQVIRTVPLQIYHAVLYFSPSASRLRQQWLADAPTWLNAHVSVPSRWSTELQRLDGMGPWLCAPAFCPNGLTMACAIGKRVFLWTLSTEHVQYLSHHSRSITSVAYSSDGKLLASVSEDSTIAIWDASSGLLETVLHETLVSIMQIAFAKDRRVLAALTDSQQVLMWDLRRCGDSATPRLSRKMSLLCTDRHPDVGKVIDSQGRLWNSMRRPCRDFRGVRSSAYDHVPILDFSIDGTSLVAGTGIGCCSVWDWTTTKKLVCISTPDTQIHAACFDEDGFLRWCESTQYLKEVMFGKLDPGSCELSTLGTIRKPTTAIASSCDVVGFSGSSKYHDRRSSIIVLWKPERPNGTALASVNSQIVHLQLDHRAELIAGCFRDGTLRIWDTQIPGRKTDSVLIDHVTVPETNHMIAYMQDGILATMNITTGRICLHEKVAGDPISFVNRGNTINMVYHYAERSSSVLGEIYIYELPAFTLRYKLDLHNTFSYHREEYRATSVAFSPDGLRALFAIHDEILLYHFSGREGNTLCICDLEEQDCEPLMIYSTDSQIVALSFLTKRSLEETLVCVYEVKWEKMTWSCRTFAGIATAMTFSADNKKLAAASAKDSVVTLWDIQQDITLCRISVDHVPGSLSFNATRHCCLESEVGVVHLDGECKIEDHDWRVEPCNRCALVDNWIRLWGEDELWLPHEHRGPVTRMSDGRLIVAQNNGFIAIYG